MPVTHGMENSYYRVAEDTSQVAQLSENALSVLIVEDDPLVRGRLADVVSGSGFIVHTASSAEEALYAFSEEFFPIVIIDRLLGASDGMHLSQQIRDLPWPGYVYIMLLTILDSS